MTTSRSALSIAVTVLVALCATGAASGGQASCLLRITYEPDDLPLNYATVEALLGSNGVLGQLARSEESIMDVVREDYGSLDAVVTVSFVPARQLAGAAAPPSPGGFGPGGAAMGGGGPRGARPQLRHGVIRPRANTDARQPALRTACH